MSNKKEEFEKFDLATILALVRDHGVHYIGCTYDGGGDEGYIQSIVYASEKYEESFSEGEIEEGTGDEGDIEFVHPKLKSIENSLEELFYVQLNKVENWWDNEGGYGTLLIDTATGEFKQHNATYTRTEENYNHVGKFTAE